MSRRGCRSKPHRLRSSSRGCVKHRLLSAIRPITRSQGRENTHQQTPFQQPTPSYEAGLIAHQEESSGTQAMVPSKLIHVSPLGQATSSGQPCCSHRYPAGHEGSCDIPRLRGGTAALLPAHKGRTGCAGEAELSGAIVTTAKKAAENQATMVAKMGTGSLERRRQTDPV